MEIANFRALFESASCAFLVMLPDAPRFTIVDASDAYLEATMTRRENIIGRPVFDVFPQTADSDAYAERNVRASFERVAGGVADSMAVLRYAIRRPDDSWETRYWSPHNSPVYVDGKVAYVLHRVEDVTAYVELQDEHEREIVRRAQELAATNERLRAVAAELEAFSAAVSHDLRAPLRAIVGYARLIDGEPMSDGGRDCLARINAAAARMAELIDGLLALSRVGRQELRLEPVDLTAMARAVAAELCEPGVEFVVADGLTATGDPVLMRVLLDNLIGNAVKYSRDSAAPRVEVGERDGAFFVRDNGIGFDQAQAGKLFVPFVRLHGEEYAGNGVGLATVRRIAHRHGGRVWAEAEPGSGAVFWWTLTA